METIADLNSLAVTWMDANKLKEAIRILVEALELTRKQLYLDVGSVTCGSSSQRHHDSSHEDKSRDYPSTSPWSSLTRAGGIATSTVANKARRIDFVNSPFQYCSAWKYQHPFSACQEMDRYTTLNGSTKTTSLTSKGKGCTEITIQLSSIIIFNLALCHDLLASYAISSARRNVLLDKAIALYEKVINLCFESSTHGMIQEDTVADSMMISSSTSSRRRPGCVGAQQDMIVMAAVNNLVQLHHESSQVRNNYMQLMIALFEEIQTTDYGSEELHRQVDLQARVFVSNTVLSSTMKLDKTAAAA